MSADKGTSPSSAGTGAGTVTHRTALACSDRSVLLLGCGQSGRWLSSSESPTAVCRGPSLPSGT